MTYSPRIPSPWRSWNPPADHAPPAQEPAAPRRFEDVAAALAVLLSRARALVNEDVTPRLPLAAYLDALAPMLAFIRAQPLLSAEPNLSLAMCSAVEQIAQDLQSVPAQPLCVWPPLSVAQQEAIRTGALLLSAYRDSIRRIARGAAGQALRAEFGVGGELDLQDCEQVAAALFAFLAAAERFPAAVSEAGIGGSQLLGLAAQARVLRAHQEHRREVAHKPGLGYRTQVLHAALAYFCDRFAAAVRVKLAERPEECLRGLRLAPRSPTRRDGGRRATDFALCRVTDSGRLIFL